MEMKINITYIHKKKYDTEEKKITCSRKKTQKNAEKPNKTIGRLTTLQHVDERKRYGDEKHKTNICNRNKKNTHAQQLADEKKCIQMKKKKTYGRKKTHAYKKYRRNRKKRKKHSNPHMKKKIENACVRKNIRCRAKQHALRKRNKK